MKYIYDDGGRKEAGFKGTTGDCVCRAIAIATKIPYKEVYKNLNEIGKTERRKRKSSARTGVHRRTYQKYLESVGWEWVPTMLFGKGCKVHLTDGELPSDRLIVQVSKHLTAVINGVIHDTFDPQRTTIIMEPGKPQRIVHRCVYGYFVKQTKKEKA